LVAYVTYKGTSLGTGQELTARIRRGLLDEDVFPFSHHHRIAADFLVEAHDRQWPGAASKELATAVASLLTDPDARVRSGAIRFFQSSRADEPGPLLSALEQDSGLFAGVSDPLPSSNGDLRAELARAAARRLGSSAALRKAIRDEALRPGRAPTVVAALAQADLEWLRSHAIDIAVASPDALDPLLYCLRSAGENLGLLLGALKTRLPPALLEAAVEGVVPAGAERDKLLGLYSR
jgi:hypothetical protein